MKAVVLARGRGQRMRAPAAVAVPLTRDQEEAAKKGWKALMPIGRWRFLDFIRSTLADAGCGDIGIVIGPDQRADFDLYLQRAGASRSRVTLIEQREPRGSADAVASAAEWVADDPFLVVNG